MVKVYILIAILLLFPLAQSHATGPSGKILVWLTLEGLDGMMVMEPDNANFRQRRERVAFPPAELLDPYTQPGRVPRRFNNRTPLLHDRMASNELAIVQRVGFSERTCSHQISRELFDRGVDRLDHPHSNGWVVRLGDRLNWSDTNYAWDLSGGSLAFDGGSFIGSTFSNINSARVNTRQNSLDSDLREEIAYSVHSSFIPKSVLAARLADQATHLLSGLYEIRDIGNEPGGALAEPPTAAYQSFPLGLALRRADHIIRNRTQAVRIIYGRIPRIFETDEDQRDYYATELSRMQSALNTFINNMEAIGHWNKVILVLAPDFGRTIPSTGRIPAGDKDTDGDPRGTACGHAGDVFILGSTSTIHGGFYGQGFSTSELSSAEIITPQFTFTQLQYAAIEALGYSANNVIDREGKTNLPNIFK